MAKQLDAEKARDMDMDVNEKKVKEMAEHIQVIERQFEEMEEETKNDKGAANLIREWAEKGAVEFDGNGVPNIIGNAGEMGMQEMSE